MLVLHLKYVVVELCCVAKCEMILGDRRCAPWEDVDCYFAVAGVLCQRCGLILGGGRCAASEDVDCLGRCGLIDESM